MAEKFATLCWQIWKSRKEEIFIFVPPLLSVRRALDWLSEYQCALTFDHGSSRKDRIMAAWSKPLQNVLKLNFDVVVFKEDNRFGLGLIARDSLGSFVLVESKSIWHSESVEEAEALALYWVVSTAKERCWRNLILKGGYKSIINSINGKGHHTCLVQTLIDNCVSLRPHFESISFVFCYRECNGVANRLARWAARGICDEV